MYIQKIDWKFHGTASQLHVLYGDIRQSWVSLKAFAPITFREQQSWLLGSSMSTIRQSFVLCTNSLLVVEWNAKLFPALRIYALR